MSTSLACMQRNGILNEWYEDICQRKAQGMIVTEWCRLRHYSESTDKYVTRTNYDVDHGYADAFRRLNLLQTGAERHLL